MGLGLIDPNNNNNNNSNHLSERDSRNSSGDIVTGYALDGRGFIPVNGKNLSVLHSVQTGSRSTRSLIRWVPGVISQRVKQPQLEADHSSSSSAEIKNDGATPPHPYMSSWHNDYIIKHGDKFTLP
jgi:hypothetical protein